MGGRGLGSCPPSHSPSGWHVGEEWGDVVQTPQPVPPNDLWQLYVFGSDQLGPWLPSGPERVQVNEWGPRTKIKAGKAETPAPAPWLGSWTPGVLVGRGGLRGPGRAGAGLWAGWTGGDMAFLTETPPARSGRANPVLPDRLLSGLRCTQGVCRGEAEGPTVPIYRQPRRWAAGLGAGPLPPPSPWGLADPPPERGLRSCTG